MTEERAPDTLLDPPPDGPVTTFPEPERLMLHMPVDIRSMSLMVLAGLGILFVLHWAKMVFIPVMLSILFSYAFSPVVNWMELKRVPRWLASSVLMLAVMGILGTTAWSLSDEAGQLIESLPVAAQKFLRHENPQRKVRQHARHRAKGSLANRAGRAGRRWRHQHPRCHAGGG